MQVFKMLVNSLPYDFDKIILIGDFSKSTLQSVSVYGASEKVHYSLSANNASVSGIETKNFHLPKSLKRTQGYYKSNLQGFSSIKEPKEIKRLIPGTVFEKVIFSEDIVQTLESAEVCVGTPNLAILNLNGAEKEFLIDDHYLLESFNCILICCSSSNTFDGASEGYKGLIKHLSNEGIPFSQLPGEVHPFHFLLIHREPLWKNKVEQLIGGKAATEEMKQALATLTQDFEKAKHEIVRMQNAALEQGVDFQRITEELEHTSNELENSKAVRADEVAKLNEARANLNKLNTDHEDAKKSLAELQNSKVLLEQELKNIKEENAEHRQSVKIANKLNLKLQVDLDDLRKKYVEKEQNEEELSKLIEELYIKLKQASEFYYELEKNHPELMGDGRD